MADVYCFGHVSTGKVYRIRGRFPEPDGYGEVVEVLENYCGEATGTALVLSRFGVSVELEGNWIGDNAEGRRTLEFLQAQGIGCSGLRIEPGYVGANEVVISDRQTRTVFGRYVDLLFTTKQWDDPSPDRIAAARLACVDPTFGETSLTAARQAAEVGVPLVTSDVRPDGELAGMAAALVVSPELLRREFPDDDWEALFDDYARSCPGLVVFTFGHEPAWFGRDGREVMRPFRVEAVDTAGAGDAFRAGIIYGLLAGWGDARTVRFACAVAGVACRTAPGVVNFPGLQEVEALLGHGAD
jgi:sugar/nucleoside kinase (ribokinase family)